MKHQILFTFAVTTLCAIAAPPAGAQVVGGQRQVGPGTPPQRDRPPTVTGTSVIRGRVIAADTGKPLRRARITARAPEAGPEPRQTSTNIDGRFELKDLPPGRYTLTVNRAGYLQLQYGQRRPLEQGKPVTILDKQALDNVDFALPKMSVITGRVFDEMNEPVAGAQVMAMRPMFFEGKRRLVPAGGTGPGANQTDDAGQFRILGLAPGTYYLMANMRDTWTVSENGVEQTFGYAPTYFPNTGNATDARRVTVGIGQEVGNNDISLIPGRAATISGTAVDSQGRPLGGHRVDLGQETRSPNMMMMMTAGGAPVNPDGTFTIKNVAPGDYKLSVRSTGPNVTIGPNGAPTGESGVVPLSVNGIDINNVSIVTSVGFSISGQVITDTGAPPTFARERPRVVARPVNADFSPQAGNPMASSGAIRDDWTFSIPSVFAASRLRVTNLPDGWMVKAILHDGREIGEAPIELKSGEEMSRIQVVVSTKVTSVTGALSNDKGEPVTDGTVIVFASDAEKWAEDSRFVRSARPDQQGQYQVKGLPPGEYLAVAVEYVQDGMWNDPEYLEGLRRYSQRFTLTESDARTLTLRMTSVDTP